jgi:hypothetical protein
MTGNKVLASADPSPNPPSNKRNDLQNSFYLKKEGQ